MALQSTRRQQRGDLAAFAREFARERHNLVTADLQRRPQTVFQQLHDRLQWTVGAEETGLTPDLRRRAGAERRPWLRQRTWPHESPALLRTLQGHAGGVGCCAFSPDGRLAASGACGGRIRIWDLG